MKDLTEKFGSNFLVAAFVPSLAFVAMAMVAFGPILPPGLMDRMKETFEPFDQSSVLLLALTIILGFTLSSLNTWIYKLLEGYFFLERILFSRRRQIRKWKKWKKQLDEVEADIANLEQLPEDDPERLQALMDRQYYIVSEMNMRFPDTEEGILPTGFGNQFRAAENYANRRYGIDAVQIWPRLVYVIPDSYYQKVEHSNNGLAFLINCSALALLFGLISVCAAGYQCLMWQMASKGETEVLYSILINRKPYYYQQDMVIYGVLALFSFVFSRVFYMASFPIVREYGDMIRSAFDLFRFDLLKQLHLALPENSKIEYERWRSLSEFIAIGEHRGPLKLEYQIATDKAAEKTSSPWWWVWRR